MMQRLPTAAWGVLLLLVSAAIPARAQPSLYSTIYRPPGVSYRVLTTPHFDVIFQQGFEQDARELAASLEKTLPGSLRLLGVEGASFHLPVVLNGFNDRSNGYVTPFPFKSEIEATSVRGDFLTPRFPSWLEQVSSHELVHAVNTEYRPGFGVGEILRLFSPDLARSLNLSAPPGITEGLAVYRESSLYPYAGRLNLAPFDMQFRAAMLPKHPWSLSQLLEPPSFTWPLDRYYNGGAHLVAYLARRDSLRSVRRANDFYYRLPFLGYGLALWYGTHTPPWTLGRRFRQAIRSEERTRIDTLGPLTQPHVVRGGEGTAYRRPHWLDDRTILVYGEGYHLTPGFYRVDAATGRRRLLAAHQITEDYAFSLNRDTTALLYARYVADPFVDIQAVSEAFRIDLNSGEEDRITHQGHVFTPVSLPDGSTWAVRNANSRSCLVDLDEGAPPATVLCIEQGDLKGIYPAPDGGIVAVLLNAGGYQGLFRVVQETGTPPHLEPWLVFDEAAIYDVDWSRDGRYLVFTVDLGEVPNAYAYDVDCDRILKLTNVPFGALEPSLSPDGRMLAFIDYHRERYDLVTIPFHPDQAENVPRALASAGRDLEWMALLDRSPQPDTLASPVRPYNPARHLRPRALYPFVQLDDTPSSDTDVGAGVGLVLQGADPLQSWAYKLKGYYQEHRIWGAASLETGTVFGRPRLTAYAKPLAVALAVGDGPRRIYEERGLSLDINTPVVFDADVSSTYASLALQGRLRDVRLLGVPGSAGVSGTRFTFKPSLRLVSGLQRNTRDLAPNAGIVFTASADADLWSNGPRKSSTTVTRIFTYLPLLRSINHAIRLDVGVLTRNENALVDASSFLPRGYEEKAIGTGRFFRYGVEYVAPLWYPDNGFVVLPVYFGAVYAYSFAEHLRAYGTDEGFRNATSLGVGLGLRVRLFFNAEADIRIGLSYRVQDGDWAVIGR